MEDKNIVLKPHIPTKDEKIKNQYRNRLREIRVSRARAAVVRTQLIEAYRVLENIRFDYVSDTAFRDMVVGAKQSIEMAISDFLMSDSYWEERYEKHKDMSPQKYDDELNKPVTQVRAK